MVRYHLITFLGLSAASFVFANPVDPQVAIQEDIPVHTTDGWSYNNCGSLESDPIQIESIQVSPDPPQPGKDLTVTVAGRAVETVEIGAYADVVVKLGLVKLLHKQFDVCDEARKANASVQCPIEEGNYVVKHTVALPREIPRGAPLNARNALILM
ncbi:Phosphatidylglycerol/phosphatidylinositol transfer protein [Tephrocybe rancida]|nr:Phosphatidylglycerol/phosphatidylinositol transfer protein [Tephrocybe rancida]